MQNSAEWNIPTEGYTGHIPLNLTKPKYIQSYYQLAWRCIWRKYPILYLSWTILIFTSSSSLCFQTCIAQWYNTTVYDYGPVSVHPLPVCFSCLALWPIIFLKTISFALNHSLGHTLWQPISIFKNSFLKWLKYVSF